ncbi:MAG: hypothetical protein R3358_09505 [Woeseiaceae bacterium]|nr:hypothetical protein [Woeseiaceae bacterium]
MDVTALTLFEPATLSLPVRSLLLAAAAWLVLVLGVGIVIDNVIESRDRKS